MAKRLLAILLLVIISSVCIAAEEYKRRWVKNATEVFWKYEKTSPNYEDYYQLTFKCGKDDKLAATVTTGRFPKGPRFKRKSAGKMKVEYQFNRNSVLEDVWEYSAAYRGKEEFPDPPNFWYFFSPNPVVFADELLEAMKNKKTQFQFQATHKLLFDPERNQWLLGEETGLDTLHFDLQGGAGAVQEVRDKCVPQ